jgi:hypothetical protein
MKRRIDAVGGRLGQVEAEVLDAALVPGPGAQAWASAWTFPAARRRWFGLPWTRACADRSRAVGVVIRSATTDRFRTPGSF